MDRDGVPPDSPPMPAPRDLVFALCHEIGNLLAAARIEAALLEHGAGSETLRRASDCISLVSARAGALLALVRPLLAPDAAAPCPTDPLEILSGLRRGLDEHCDDRVVIDFAAVAALPRLELAVDVLHHLLLSAIFLGLEAGAPAGGVRVSARRMGGDVAFQVDDAGVPETDVDPPALRGRPLVLATARALLGPSGGRAELAPAPGGTRLTFRIPTAPADAGLRPS